MYNVIIITGTDRLKEKSDMKRLLPFIISFVFLISLSLSGCSEPDRNGELREFLSLNEDAFGEAYTEDPCDFRDFCTYMENWANANSIEIVNKSDHAIVLRNKAVSGFEKEPRCVLLCPFNTDNAKKNKAIVATGQTALLGPVSHGEISLVIAERAGDRFIGIEDVPDKCLKCDHLIELNTANSNNILISGPVTATARFHNSGSKEESDYAQAFRLTMSMPEYTDPYDSGKDSNYPNPINIIGDFLASGQSSGKLFDIASFKSKSHEGYTPYFASAVIVVDANHIESFQTRFEKSFDKMQDRFEDLEEDFVFTMEETDMPESVLSDEVAEGLISLMYTLNTGVCEQDEESGVIYSASYIDSIQTDHGDLDLSVNIRARGESYMDTLSAEYETTAGLCSTDYKLSKYGRLWAADPNGSLVTFFTGRVPQTGPAESSISLKNFENDIVAKRLPDQNMIIYSFEKSDRKTVLENITDFLDPSVPK